MATDILLGFDDTDSRDGMCTTYIASITALKFREFLSDYPMLVRLNPNIPYKTRGNGALSLRFFCEPVKREAKIIGYHQGRYVYTGSSCIGDIEKLGREVWDEIRRFSMPGENTNPGMVIFTRKMGDDFYRKAVTGVIENEKIGSLIQESTFSRHMGNGRGIIGATAACSWSGYPFTYEVMAYRFPSAPVVDENVKMMIADFVDKTGKTFNTIDRKNKVAAIFPNPRTPVIFGIRGMDPEALLRIAVDVVHRFSIDHDFIMTFRTNQGTDDHIIHGADVLREYSSYCIAGRIVKGPTVIEGGHYFSLIEWYGGKTKIAAFEPTKEFRKVFRELKNGDLIEACGSYMGGTLNLERINVIALARTFEKEPPICPACKRRMKNRGGGEYRCPSCSRKSFLPGFVELNRNLLPGIYSVPVCAMRHLSRPGDFPGGLA